MVVELLEAGYPFLLSVLGEVPLVRPEGFLHSADVRDVLPEGQLPVDVHIHPRSL